jgi:hypothetical protein
VSERKRWFAPNRGGVGLHPTSWQGWVIILAVAAAILVIILAARGKL